MAQDQQRNRPDDQEQRQDPAGEQPQARKPHMIEWIVGAASAAIVVAMIGFVLHEAISTSTPDPVLDVAVERIGPVNGRFQVRFSVTNRGDVTAASIEVEGQLSSGDRTVETSSVTVDFVPARSAARASLLFGNDPDQHQLRLEAKGYTDP